MSDAMTRLNAALEGRYTIERELGEGGMANVYLADDLKHGRKVALKVLKPELAAVVGAERFLSEIKTTANLQHPNILPLFDSGEADSFLFYVMPYVQGESLRGRLDREHQLPVDEAVRIASEVADALQAAHEQGVVHRDIKPANILLSRGRPLVADFGIALAVSAAGGARLTETGLSLGTPQYMSPEQATGDPLTGPATDTYALGCVLYETLVGEAPYTGTTAQAILGRIISGGPVSTLKHRPSVPANVDAAIRKTLEKLPADRFSSAQGFAQALADPAFRYAAVAEAEGGVGVAARPPTWRRALPWGLTTALAVALVVVASRPPGVTPQRVQFTLPIAEEDGAFLGGPYALEFGRSSKTSVAISPDGDLLVYAAATGRGRSDLQLYTRWLDRESAEPIAGTEGAESPFFSPDGAWIGFTSGALRFAPEGEFLDDPERALKRLLVADGTIETITQVPRPPLAGVTWGDDGTIVAGAGDGSLYRVPATGGEWELLLEAPGRSPGEMAYYLHPHMLPGSEVVLFQALHRSFLPELAEIRALDLATGTQSTILTDAMDPRYLETGHLLFVRQGTLMAVGFDPERVEVLGQPVNMAEDVGQAVFMPNSDLETGAAQFAVSASGHLVYARGGVYSYRMPAVLITSAGDTVPLEMQRRDYVNFRVSPDGSRLAFTEKFEARTRIGVRDLDRGVTGYLPSEGGVQNWQPVWSPDGRTIAFNSDRDVPRGNVYSLAADFSGEPERLAPSDEPQIPASWSSDGVFAFLQRAGPRADGRGTQGDIWVLPPDGPAEPFFTSEANEEFPTFSPDGQWLAYMSDVSGRPEVYVRPYPGGEPATQISGNGGDNVAWAPDGRQIYYAQGPVLMAVDVTPGDEFQAGRPAPLIDRFDYLTEPIRGYDVFPDGSFVVSPVDRDRLFSTNRADELHVILNWAEELKERVPN